MVTAAIDVLRDLGILQAIQAAAVIYIAYFLFQRFFDR